MKNNILYLLSFILTFVGCNNEDCEEMIQKSHLNIEVSVEGSKSRVLVNAMENGYTIGLTLDGSASGVYDDTDYNNVKATAQLTQGKIAWSLDKDILLTEQEATLYAYYPWSDKVKDLSQVPVETASQTDYMYAIPVTGVCNLKPDAQVTLQHALAAFRISFTRATYEGAGSVTSISVSGTNIASEALLDARTGTLSDYEITDGGVTVTTNGVTLDNNKQSEIIFIPVMDNEAEQVLTITLDGEQYSYTIPTAKLNAGTIYNYKFKMDTSELTLAAVTIGDWGYTQDGYPKIKVGDHTVTFSGNIEDIAFNNSVDENGTLTVKAIPMVEGKEVADVTISGTESVTFDQQFDSDTGVLTVTLSNVTADQNIVFNGAWYQVLLAGDMAWMTIKRSRAANGTMTVTATPDDEGDYVNEGTGQGSATFSQTFDEVTGIRTFTIASQTSPYILNLNGVGSEWLIVTYDVAETGEQNILCPEDDSSNSRFFDLISVDKMKVDGEEMKPSRTYNFTTTGKFSIKYRLIVPKYIPKNMFSGITNLVNFRITNSVTSIGEYAFAECTGLTSVTIPNSVTEIGHWAFYRCKGLTSVTIPNSVTSIGNYAFWNCSQLTALDLGTGVQTIGNYAFCDCKGLTGELVIPNSVTTIGEWAFDGCSGLTALDLGTGVKTIGRSAFNCSGLTGTLIIPNSVTSIGSEAFKSCRELTGIIVKEGNTVYDSRNNCNAIMETATNTLLKGCYNTIIPDDTEAFGWGAFYKCTGLTGTLNIPSSVTHIYSDAFYGCTGLTGTLNIPSSVTYIGAYAFWGCKGLTGKLIIPDSVTEIGGGAFRSCTGFTGELVIPDSMTEINRICFKECTGLTSLVIPESVETIREEAFYGCSFNKITSKAKTAPYLEKTFNSSKCYVFYLVDKNGILYIPQNSSYSSWMSTADYYLGYYNWTIQYLDDL